MRATGICVIHAIAMMGVLWAARGGEAPAAKPLFLVAITPDITPTSSSPRSPRQKVPLVAQCRLLGHEPPAVGRTKLELRARLLGRRVDRGSGLRVCLKR